MVLASRQRSQSAILSSEFSKKPEVSLTSRLNVEHKTWIMKSKQDWPRCLQQWQRMFCTISAGADGERQGEKRHMGAKEGDRQKYSSTNNSNKSSLFLYHPPSLPEFLHIRAYVVGSLKSEPFLGAEGSGV